ncbi:hypothetical protein ACFS5J_09075 [Flavobacterium chuncheonense]|uniref:Secreted protein n=1 Tax=Flavobacterium chuncheonense TaxID=2026653 RepID=A0ABW5YM38_9FLAO
MKKAILFSVFALAISSTFVSCSTDDFESEVAAMNNEEVQLVDGDTEIDPDPIVIIIKKD